MDHNNSSSTNSKSLGLLLFCFSFFFSWVCGGGLCFVPGLAQLVQSKAERQDLGCGRRKAHCSHSVHLWSFHIYFLPFVLSFQKGVSFIFFVPLSASNSLC